MEADNIRLEHFFEMSPALMCIAGYDGFFRKVNPAAINLLGYTEEELLSKPINYFIHPDDRDKTSQTRDDVRKGLPLINFENRYFTKSGELVWLQWTTISDAENLVIYGIAKNVTQRKRMEAERNNLLEHLSNINAELKLKSWSTTHDLRSPLGNLLDIFDMLDLSKIEDHETVEFLHMLRSATSTLKNTLDNYLDSISTEFDSDPDLVQVDVPKTLDRVLNSLSTSLKLKQATVETDFSGSGTIYFNRENLESILLNLVSNSIKYSQPDQSLRIEVTTLSGDGFKQLVYSDNGIGFDMEAVRGKLFGFQQSFSTNKDSKGIGLFLVQTYMNRFGGKIELESEPGKGSTFTLTFREPVNPIEI
jgi:PAS domain S-box-containing protein